MRKNDRKHGLISLDDPGLRNAPSPMPTPEVAIVEKEYLEHILICLTPKERERLKAFCFDGMSLVQIANMEGVAYQCVQESIRCAKKKLRLKIAK